MTGLHRMREIRADYDQDTIVVYQAYNQAIAQAALQAQRLVAPFSYTRMTWIKPSFLWLMARSNWGQKPNQEYTLAVRIKRTCWEAALEQAVLTTYHPQVYQNPTAWRESLRHAQVRVQWDPERSVRGTKQVYRSIQVGIGRGLIQAYAQEWIVAIHDYTPLVAKLQALRQKGAYDKLQKLLPRERLYPLAPAIRERIAME